MGKGGGREGWLWGLLGLLCILSYGSMFPNGFVWDDQEFIVRNRAIQSLWPPAYLLGNAGSGFPWLGQRPAAGLSLAIDYALGRGQPFPFHLSQLLLHGLCVGGVVLLGRVVFRDRRAGFLSGAVFAVHPGHGEAVVAFLGRTDLLATAFTLGATLAYWKTREDGSHRVLFYGVSVACFGLGCLAKETALSFLGIFWLLEGLRWKGGRWAWKGALVRCAPFLGVALLYGLYRYHLLSAVPVQESWWSREPAMVLRMIIVAFGQSLRLMLFPSGLSPWYDAATLQGLSTIWVVFGAASLALVLGLLLLGWFRDKAKAFSLGWFLFGLAPICLGWLLPLWGWKGLGGMPGAVLAERWLYLPSAGICLLAGWAGASFWQRISPPFRPALLAGLGILMALLIGRQTVANKWWKDEESIARAIVSEAPASALGHYNLGNEVMRKGQLSAAELTYREAIRLKPDYVKAWNNLGVVLRKQGRDREAEEAFRKALEGDPRCAEAHNNLGILGADRKDFSAAESAFIQAIQADPGYAEAHFNLGTVWEDQGDYERAEGEYREAIRLDPSSAKAFNNLGNVLVLCGKWEDAVQAFRESLRLDPRDPAPCYNLGLVLIRLERHSEAASALKDFLARGGRDDGSVRQLVQELNER